MPNPWQIAIRLSQTANIPSRKAYNAIQIDDVARPLLYGLVSSCSPTCLWKLILWRTAAKPCYANTPVLLMYQLLSSRTLGPTTMLTMMSVDPIVSIDCIRRNCFVSSYEKNCEKFTVNVSSMKIYVWLRWISSNSFDWFRHICYSYILIEFSCAYFAVHWWMAVHATMNQHLRILVYHFKHPTVKNFSLPLM